MQSRWIACVGRGGRRLRDLFHGLGARGTEGTRGLGSVAVGWAAVLCGPAVSAQSTDGGLDPRDVRAGLPIPDEGYCDQPRVAVLSDGTWVCVLTTAPGHEGSLGQHVVATRSTDRGRTWSPLVDVEASDPERPASYAVVHATPFDRVYAFYTYNGDAVWARPGRDERIRSDTHGWWCFRYSDDGGATWSARHRMPMRVTACDRGNDWGGEVQMFWAIGRPVRTTDGAVVFGFTKLARYFLVDGEGWFWRSENLDTERDPAKLSFELLPEGEHGLRHPEFGSVQEEFNVVPMSDGGLACVWRTTQGFPAIAYSTDGGRSWGDPGAMSHAPGGRVLRNPRACPKVWRTSAGRYLFWFHHHGGRDFSDRNPAWLVGGVERDGRLVWSEPEMVLFGSDRSYATGRFSYPDLIETDDGWFIAETQKTVARIHRIDPALLEGMWAQVGAGKPVATPAPVLDWRRGPDGGTRTDAAAWPDGLTDLAAGGGLTIVVEVASDPAPSADRDLLRVDGGEARLALRHARDAADRPVLTLELTDGEHRAAWSTDPLPAAPTATAMAFVLDGGADLLTVVTAGELDDGGPGRTKGFTWLPAALSTAELGGVCQPGPGLRRLRVFDRALRTAVCVPLTRAGR